MTIEEFEKFDLNHTVCECFEISLSELLDAVKAGHNTLEDLMDETDAGTACELCRSCDIDEDGERVLHLEEILKYVKEKEALS